MTEKETKKKLITGYKERIQTGGVYIIRNNKNNKIFLDCSADIGAISNRFEFSKQMNFCVNAKLKKDWDAFGGGAFSLEVLETLEKNETQTAKSFSEDLSLLKDLWFEKLNKEDIY